jgi:3-phenylpropionate/trans-cinnamate dioxygenase ferredoxin reductase subunit
MTEPSKGAGNSPEAIDQSQAHVVIVGAGQAGLSTAESLRSGGYTGFITMLGDEPTGPYHRPPLSKAWLAGELAEAQLMMRAPELLARKGILLRTDSRDAELHRLGHGHGGHTTHLVRAGRRSSRRVGLAHPRRR